MNQCGQKERMNENLLHGRVACLVPRQSHPFQINGQLCALQISLWWLRVLEETTTQTFAEGSVLLCKTANKTPGAARDGKFASDRCMIYMLSDYKIGCLCFILICHY